MKIIPKFYGEVNDGKLVVENKDKFDLFVGTLSGKVEIVVKPWRKTRSGQQNKYLWGVVYKIIAEYTGEDIMDIHNNFKYKLLKSTGKSGKLHSCKSTTKLSTADFTDYIEKIKVWASGFGLNIPSPDDIDLDNIQEYII